jgi:hypothetical protein
VSRWERWSFNALAIVVTLSGAAYLWMKYLLHQDDPFAVVNHPWQPSALAAHVMAAPFLMLLFGIVFRAHVLSKLANGRRGRFSGWSSLVTFAAMAVTGYLLQVVTDPVGLRTLTLAHLVSSAAFVLGYSAHLVVGWRARAALPVGARWPAGGDPSRGAPSS